MASVNRSEYQAEKGKNNMTREARVLVVAKNSDAQEPFFQGRFEGTSIRFARSQQEVTDALATFRPTVALCHHDGAIAKAGFLEILKSPDLEWLSNGGAGVEHLGKWDPTARIVTNASGVNARYLAEFTIAAHMAANVGLFRYQTLQRQHRWEQMYWKPFQGRRFCVVGLGSVGRAVGAEAKRLGMQVVGTRGTARPTEGIDVVFGPDGLHTALTGADFVSVHAAQTPETIGLIDDAAFAAMPDGVIFLNAARGPVVDEAALIRALDAGKIGTAVLDVFDTEPLPADSPLWDYENVLITPHVADSISNWQENMTAAFADNLERWLAGKDLQNIVDPALGY